MYTLIMHCLQDNDGAEPDCAITMKYSYLPASTWGSHAHYIRYLKQPERLQNNWNENAS